jgi:CBS domain containing-hemolysin-like protein
MTDTQTTTQQDEAGSDTSGEEPRSPNLPALYQAPERSNTPNFLQRLAYAFRPKAHASIRQNLQDALDMETLHDQTISPAERAMLSNILRLREVRVADVMIPRADIEAVEETTSLGDLLALFEGSGHSRMPVFKETLDDPRGMIHIRDVVAYIVKTAKNSRRARKSTAAAKNGKRQPAIIGAFDPAKVDLDKTIAEIKLARPVLFVPPSMLATDLMARMQAERTQMALVIDEYGGTDGLASLEDIVEMVVGDIEDEHDDDEELKIEQRDDGSFLVDARVELEKLDARLEGGFLDAAHQIEDEVDTVGGLVFSLLGRVPARGEIVHGLPGYEIEVRDADPRRIRSAVIRAVKQAARRRPQRPARTETEHYGEALSGADEQVKPGNTR